MYPTSMPLYELCLSRSCFICTGHLQKVLQKQAYSSLLSATLTALWAIRSCLAKAIAVGKASTIQNALTASSEMPLLSRACLQGQLWEHSLCIVLRVAVSSTRVGLLFSLQMAGGLSHHENSVDGKSSQERGSAMALGLPHETFPACPLQSHPSGFSSWQVLSEWSALEKTHYSSLCLLSILICPCAQESWREGKTRV